MQQVPVAIFTCRTNSHPFQERQISVHEPVKVGRSVARVRPAQNNAIFDCRVLSRNHALLWYENNKFYLQDTKSSNGTFVNNQRLSKASEESSPQEVSSGDAIQFGVDVMENSRTRGEDVVTHSCIIATVQLFHPDGSEARRDYNPFAHVSGGVAIQSQELYQLSQYLQEALHREQMLENKLATLQRLVDSTQDASESGWQALIDEDRLLSKLEVLQNQLQVYSKVTTLEMRKVVKANQTEDTLRQELTALQEDKYNYENTAKESLRKVLEEKLEAVRKLSELEQSLGNTEDECTHLRDSCVTSQKNLEELAQKHQDQLQEMANMHEKLQEADKLHKEEMETLSNEKQELWEKLQDMIRQEGQLQAKVEALQADNDFTKEQLANMRVKMDSIKETSHDSLRIPELNSQGIQVEMVNLLDLQQLTAAQDSSSDDDDDSEKDDNDVEMKDSNAKEVADALADLDFELDKEEDEVDSLNEKQLAECDLSQHSLDSSDGAADLSQHPLDQSEEDSAIDQSEPSFSSLSHDSDSAGFMDTLKPEKLRDTQSSIEQYRKLLIESDQKQKDSKAKIKQLQNELASVKSECAGYLGKIQSLEDSLNSSEAKLSDLLHTATQDLSAQLDESRKQENNNASLTSQLQQQIKELESQLDAVRREKSRHVITVEKQGSSAVTSGPVQDTSLQQQLEKVKELLQESRAEQTSKQTELDTLKERLLVAHEAHASRDAEVTSLQAEVQRASQQVHDKAATVTQLQEQLDRAELSAKEVKEQILVLRDRIVEEQEHSQLKSEQDASLAIEVEEWQEKARLATDEAETLRVQLSEMRSKQKGEDESSPSELTKQQETNSCKTEMCSEDLSSIREECSHLKERIQLIEDAMKSFSEKKGDKSMTLHESYVEVKAIKDGVELQESVWATNLTDSQKGQDKLKEAHEEIVRLEKECAQYQEKIVRLQTELKEAKEKNGNPEYDQLAYTSKVVFTCSMIPLFVLVFAIFLAAYPFLSWFTATSH